MYILSNTKLKPALPATLAMSVFLLAVFGLTGCDANKEEPKRELSPDTSTLRSELQNALNEWRIDERITGASMSIDSPSTGTISLASGNAKLTIDPERFSNEPLTVDHPMFVGDITHVLVAATIIQLAQENRVQFDSTLEAWFPQAEHADRISVRNLLEHTSGIPVFYTEDFLDSIYDLEPGRERKPDDVIRVATAQGSFFEPGSQYGYSKTNFLILGRIIELVTGSALENELRSRFLDPLGMANTFLAGREPVPGGTPLGYEYAGPNSQAPTLIEGHVPQEPGIAAVSSEWASGALVSTVGDLTLLIDALFTNPEYSDLRREMTRIAAHPAQTGTPTINSGAGVFVWNETDEQVVGQFGFIYPFSAQFIHWTVSKTTVVVLANEVDSSRNPNSNFQLPVIENLTTKTKQLIDNQ